MGIADMKVLRFADIRNRVLRLGNVHVWIVPPCYVVDLLLLRNCIFGLRIVYRWGVLSLQCLISDDQESRIHVVKCSDMGIAVMK